jgi:pimeloyl-ACP methyl ester carboxylesterase
MVIGMMQEMSESLVILNRKGKRMPAVYTTSPTSSRGLAIIFHGLGGYQELPVLKDAREALSTLGYSVLSFDASDGAKGPDADFFNNTNTGYVEDVEDLMAHIQALSWYTKPTLMLGHSQGALVLLAYLHQHPDDEPDRIILLAPAVSWKHSLLSLHGVGSLLRIGAWLVVGEVPWPGPDGKPLRLGRRWLLDFLTYNGTRYARDITAQVLLVSAECDQTVATPKYHRAFAKHFVHIRHEVIKGALHAFPNHTKAVADTIRTWLSSS